MRKFQPIQIDRASDLLARLRASALVGPGVLTGLAIVGGLLVTFASQMLISRHLGVGPYGQYALLVGWSMLLVLPASLGIDGSILRFVPGYLARGEVHRYRWLITICLAGQLAAVLIIVGILYLFHRLDLPAMSWVNKITLALVGCLIAAMVLGNSALAVLQAARRVIIAQLFNQLFRPLLVLIGAAALIYGVGGGFDATDLFAVTVLSAVVATSLLLAHVTTKYLVGPASGRSSLEVRPWLTFATGNLAGGIGQQALIQIPLLLVGNLSNIFEAGHYSVASRLAATVLLGLVALTTVSMPLLAAAFDREDRNEIQRIATFNARLALAFALIVAAGLALLGPFILRLFGPGFSDAYPVLMLLVAGLVAASAFGSAVGLVAMSGRPSVVGAANAIGVLLTILIAWLAVPRFGAIGGASAYAIWNIAAVAGVSSYARFRLGYNTSIFARLENDAPSQRSTV